MLHMLRYGHEIFVAHSRAIFLINRLGAPQKEVDVRLAHPFSPPAPLLAAGTKKMCGSISPRAKKKMGSLFAAGDFFLGLFLLYFRQFHLEFLCVLFEDLSSKL